MGILEAAKPTVVVCTRDRDRATAFYRDTLGLVMAYEENLAAVFNLGGITLRISTVADFSPHEHTILGFRVADVPLTVRALREKGLLHAFTPSLDIKRSVLERHCESVMSHLRDPVRYSYIRLVE